MFWEQLKENVYSDDYKRMIKKRKWSIKKKASEGKPGKENKEFEIESVVRITEEIKQSLKKGVKTYRKRRKRVLNLLSGKQEESC